MNRKPKYLDKRVKERRKLDKVRAFYCGAQWTAREVAAMMDQQEAGSFAVVPVLDPFAANKRMSKLIHNSNLMAYGFASKKQKT
jgi:hypothetical protein